MATDHLKAFYGHLISAVEGASDLDGLLSSQKVWTYPEAVAHSGYKIDMGKATISIFPGDTSGEDAELNDATQTDIMPTDFNIVIETKIVDSADAFKVDEASQKMTLLDLEYRVLRALQNPAFKPAAITHCAGWVVSGINRDIPVLDEEGDLDPETRRTEMVITADIYLDRTETGGPWR